MKIAILSDFPIFVIPEFGKDYRPKGHYATWLPQLVRAFAEHPGLDIHWITLTRAVSAPRTVSWSNQTFHILPAGKTGSRATTFYYRDRQAIQACLHEIAPQLVHGWGSEDVYGLAAVRSGYPNIVSMQGILSHYVLKTFLGLRSYLLTLMEMFILYKADSVTVESPWGREKLLRRNPVMKIDLIEYGVDDHFLDITWRPDHAVPAALFVGSLVPRKGIQDLVAAFSDPALAHAELWVAGDAAGPWIDQLRAKSPANVKWLGRQSSAETATLMSRAWCLALPTRADTSPNVVKEARVIGLPVISTPCGGQASYVENSKNGFLVAPGDIDSLSKALQTVLGDFDQCREMGAYLHQEHREFLHPKQTAEKFVALYRKRLALSGSA